MGIGARPNAALQPTENLPHGYRMGTVYHHLTILLSAWSNSV